MNDDHDKRRILNLIEDIRRLQIPKIERMEKTLDNSKAVAWTGVVLGTAGVAIGGFILWTLYDRGWW